MNTALLTYIQQCTTLKPSDYEGIMSHFKLVEYPKKTILLQEGAICKFEGFVTNGCIKTYYVDQNGFEVILTFATENWWVSDIASFQEQKPSKTGVETIEKTELLLLTYQAKEALLIEYPALERMFRLMVQRHLAAYQERLFSNIALSAEQRYDNFLQKFPDLPQRIPQHLIASFLGISPEFLSRLRKRKLKKQ